MYLPHSASYTMGWAIGTCMKGLENRIEDGVRQLLFSIANWFGRDILYQAYRGVQPDNGTIRGVGHKTVFCLLGVFSLNKFTFSHCLMPTVSVIIKRYLCGENASKFMIHYVLWVVFLSFMKYCLSLSRSTGHQQHAIGLNMANAILSF